MAAEGPERPERPEPRCPVPERPEQRSPGPAGLVFAASVARTLRERLRLRGRLVGPRGRRGRPRGQRLPLQLRPEEMRLLGELPDGAAAMGLNWDPPPPNGSPTACDPAHPRDPDSAPQRRFRVFRALWRRGLHVTGGGKFGGDFLVYPGPPERFHAVGVACAPAPWAELPALGLVAAARLGSNVRKTALLCAGGGAAGGGACTALQWRADL